MITPPLPPRRLLVGDYQEIVFVLVGCGGTGSYIALNLAQMVYNRPENMHLFFVDGDVVEKKNVGRQYFCEANLGENKAEVLGRRLGLAYGVKISAIPHFFKGNMVPLFAPSGKYYKRFALFERDSLYTTSKKRTLVMVIGAVDNAQARSDIAASVHYMNVNGHYGSTRKDAWYIDAGNSRMTGQVLIGNKKIDNPEVFATGEAVALPLPTVTDPELLSPPPPAQEDEVDCATRTMVDPQTRPINFMMAAWVDTMVELFLSNKLTYLGVRINLEFGLSSPIALTPGKDDRIVPVNALSRSVDSAQFFEAYGDDEDEPILVNCPTCGNPLVNGHDDDVPITYCPTCDWTLEVEAIQRLWQSGGEALIVSRITDMVNERHVTEQPVAEENQDG